jgi:hypothetical protein
MRPFSLFFVISAIPLAGACTILGGGDDSSSNAATPNADAGAQTYYGEKSDSGSHPTTTRDSGSSDTGTSTPFGDGGATTTRIDGGDGTGGSGGDPQCATLADCCATLPPGPGWADTCNEEVGFGNDTECGSLYGTYQTDGYCNGNPGGLSDNCYALSQCCESLTGADLTSCNNYVSGNVDGTCQDVLTSYEDQALCD